MTTSLFVYFCVVTTTFNSVYFAILPQVCLFVYFCVTTTLFIFKPVCFTLLLLSCCRFHTVSFTVVMHDIRWWHSTCIGIILLPFCYFHAAGVVMASCCCWYAAVDILLVSYYYYHSDDVIFSCCHCCFHTDMLLSWCCCHSAVDMLLLLCVHSHTCICTNTHMIHSHGISIPLLFTCPVCTISTFDRLSTNLLPPVYVLVGMCDVCVQCRWCIFVWSFLFDFLCMYFLQLFSFF